MHMKPLCKRVGSVNVYEFDGDFQGDEVGENDFGSDHSQMKGVLFNARNLNQFDEHGLKAILNFSRVAPKRAVISSSRKLYEKFRKTSSEEHLQMFQNERVAAFYLAEEFVEGRDPEVIVSEKRKFPRLKAAMPLHFSFDAESGEKAHFFAIVTNLSESGLYAEFMGAREETELLDKLSEYDLKLLNLKLHLSPTQVVHLRAKMVRMNEPRTGIAMEFYESDEKEVQLFRAWMGQKNFF